YISSGGRNLDASKGVIDPEIIAAPPINSHDKVAGVIRFRKNRYSRHRSVNDKSRGIVCQPVISPWDHPVASWGSRDRGCLHGGGGDIIPLHGRKRSARGFSNHLQELTNSAVGSNLINEKCPRPDGAVVVDVNVQRCEACQRSHRTCRLVRRIEEITDIKKIIERNGCYQIRFFDYPQPTPCQFDPCAEE